MASEIKLYSEICITHYPWSFSGDNYNFLLSNLKISPPGDLRKVLILSYFFFFLFSSSLFFCVWPKHIQTSFRLGSIPQGKCMFWKPGEAKNWNTRGCWLVTRKSNFEVTTCECNHLTVFAALMDPYGRTVSYSLHIP